MPASYARSVPGCPHVYPLVVREDSFSNGFKLAWQTKAYAFYRYLHTCFYFLITGLMIAAFLAGGGAIAFYVHKVGGAVVTLLGVAALGFFWFPFVAKKLLETRCGHVAILTELITKGQIGNGEESMFAFGGRLVESRLAEIDTLWTVYRNVRSTLSSFYRVLDNAEDWLPINLSWIEGATKRLVAWASPYVSAVIISYGLARGDRDFAAAGLDGVCYSAQNGKDLFKTAIRVAIWDKLMMFPVWLLSLAVFWSASFYLTFEAMGGDFAALMADPGHMVMDQGLAFMIAFFVAVFIGTGLSLFTVMTIRESIVEPTLVTMVVVKFHSMVENQPLDTSWKERIQSATGSLEELDNLLWRNQRHAPLDG